MMKPHIWLRNGDFTGDLQFSTEAEWERFETSYKKYIMLYAKISEKNHIEILCIGTELYHFVSSRPEFWKELISDIRRFTKGNWYMLRTGIK